MRIFCPNPHFGVISAGKFNSMNWQTEWIPVTSTEVITATSTVVSTSAANGLAGIEQIYLRASADEDDNTLVDVVSQNYDIGDVGSNDFEDTYLKRGVYRIPTDVELGEDTYEFHFMPSFNSFFLNFSRPVFIGDNLTGYTRPSDIDLWKTPLRRSNLVNFGRMVVFSDSPRPQTDSSSEPHYARIGHEFRRFASDSPEEDDFINPWTNYISVTDDETAINDIAYLLDNSSIFTRYSDVKTDFDVIFDSTDRMVVSNNGEYSGIFLQILDIDAENSNYQLNNIVKPVSYKMTNRIDGYLTGCTPVMISGGGSLIYQKETVATEIDDRDEGGSGAELINILNSWDFPTDLNTKFWDYPPLNPCHYGDGQYEFSFLADVASPSFESVTSAEINIYSITWVGDGYGLESLGGWQSASVSSLGSGEYLIKSGPQLFSDYTGELSCKKIGVQMRYTIFNSNDSSSSTFTRNIQFGSDATMKPVKGTLWKYPYPYSIPRFLDDSFTANIGYIPKKVIDNPPVVPTFTKQVGTTTVDFTQNSVSTDSNNVKFELTTDEFYILDETNAIRNDYHSGHNTSSGYYGKERFHKVFFEVYDRFDNTYRRDQANYSSSLDEWTNIINWVVLKEDWEDTEINKDRIIEVSVVYYTHYYNIKYGNKNERRTGGFTTTSDDGYETFYRKFVSKKYYNRNGEEVNEDGSAIE